MNGNYFAVNGISGLLVAVVLLLSIIGGLSVCGVLAQQSSAVNPYVVTGSYAPNPVKKEDVFANLKSVQMYDATANSKAFKKPDLSAIPPPPAPQTVEAPEAPEASAEMPVSEAPDEAPAAEENKQ
ncbi:MAG: DUF4006 family protein [Helicobacteraceae bacterium]|jgi:hypothetical protein|nr:DUF4006 family protein [Helicobacteraceae bacterium]